MIILTEAEKQLLTDCEDFFVNTNINDALYNLILTCEEHNKTAVDGDGYILFSNLFRYLCEGTDLINEIDDTIANEYGPMGLTNCGVKKIDNSLMSIFNFDLGDPNLESVRCPNIIASNLGSYLFSIKSTNLTEIYLPDLTDYNPDFCLIDVANIHRYNQDLKIYTNAGLINQILEIATKRHLSQKRIDWLKNALIEVKK